MRARSFPPFELQAGSADLEVLGTDLSGLSVERWGQNIHRVWLRSCDGQVWSIQIDQRDLEFKFEVFTLRVETLEALQGWVAAWPSPELLELTSEDMREAMLSRPRSIPMAPAEYDPWPFETWTTHVLRRVEFVIDDVEADGTFGENPSAQDALRPGESIPTDASAFCEVSVALLFTGGKGERLLVGADWFPMNMIVTQSAAKIDEYLTSCEMVELAAYAARLDASG